MRVKKKREMGRLVSRCEMGPIWHYNICNILPLGILFSTIDPFADEESLLIISDARDRYFRDRYEKRELELRL